MKPEITYRALKNATSHKACLAMWQSLPLAERQRRIKNYWRKEASFSEKRKSLIVQLGPELSEPEACLLWVGKDSPEILDWFDASNTRRSLDHYGWFYDEWEQFDTVQAVAVRLKRFPHWIFGGTFDSQSDAACIHLDEVLSIEGEDVDAAACEMLHMMDSVAERQAEREKDYQIQARLELEAQERRARLAKLRQEIRALVAELKKLCGSPLASQFPAVAGSVKSALRALLSERKDLIEENLRA
jgi:hypothetical protein